MKYKIKIALCRYIDLIYIAMIIFGVIGIACMLFDIFTDYRYSPLTILITVTSIAIVSITDILSCIVKLEVIKHIEDKEVRELRKDSAINQTIICVALQMLIIAMQLSNLS